MNRDEFIKHITAVLASIGGRNIALKGWPFNQMDIGVKITVEYASDGTDMFWISHQNTLISTHSDVYQGTSPHEAACYIADYLEKELFPLHALSFAPYGTGRLYRLRHGCGVEMVGHSES